MTTATVPERQFTGRHFLIIILSFFGVIIGVNVWLSVVAYQSWTGVVVAKPYELGQNFNDMVELANEQNALGWKGSLTYTDGTLRFEVLDSAGKPLEVADVAVAITRHIGVANDQTLPMVMGPDGSFSVAPRLPPGRWDAVATAGKTPHGAFERRLQFVTN